MKKTTKNIGKISGKILVFGGIYSNFQALEKMMDIAKAENILPQNIICTGDVVGYCAEPERCLQTVKDWGIHTILGNVEIQLRDDENDCGCNFNDNSRCDIFSKQWFPFAQKSTSEGSKQWLKTLPDHLTFEYGNKKCLVVHGNYFETSGYIFRSTDWATKQENFDAANVEVIFGGHCGLPFASVQKEQYWLNAGVIGMPGNDGTTKVWYMVLDENPFSFQHQSFEYDFKTAQNLMAKNGLPKAYSETLATGVWDNCEILPDAETSEQGRALCF
jgi:predicted phosphodiesterase